MPRPECTIASYFITLLNEIDDFFEQPHQGLRCALGLDCLAHGMICRGAKRLFLYDEAKSDELVEIEFYRNPGMHSLPCRLPIPEELDGLARLAESYHGDLDSGVEEAIYLLHVLLMGFGSIVNASHILFWNPVGEQWFKLKKGDVLEYG